MLFQEFRDAICPTECSRQEGQRLFEAIIRFSTTEAEKPMARIAEALPTEASDAELVVGTFEQIQREAVTRDAKSIANGGHVRKDIERRLRIKRVDSFDLIETVGQQHDFLTKQLHLAIAFGVIALEGIQTGQLHDGRRTGQCRVDHLGDGVCNGGRSHGEAQTPATHTVRLAEGVRGDALIQHVGLFEQ